MKQYSPARLTKPFEAQPGTTVGRRIRRDRRDEAYALLEERLRKTRHRSEEVALFTGRDQMQALTGLFAASSARPTTPRMAGSAR